MCKKSFSFTLKCNFQELEALRHEVETFGIEKELPKKSVMELNLVLDELFTNVLTHGFPNEVCKPVNIGITLIKDELIVRVEDEGVPFNPLETDPPDLEKGPEERTIGGLGIHLVKNIMDHVEYRRSNKRNILTLKKTLKKNRSTQKKQEI